MADTALEIIHALAVLSGIVGLRRAVHMVVQGRNEVALERARSETTLAAIDRLPAGARLLEHDADGRILAIDIAPVSPRMPGSALERASGLSDQPR